MVGLFWLMARRNPIAGSSTISNTTPTRTHNRLGFAVLMAGLVVLKLAPRAHASDACSEARQQTHTIGSFINCLNLCLGPKQKVDVSSAVQCLPDGCFVTVTMSPQSAQRACSLGGCRQGHEGGDHDGCKALHGGCIAASVDRGTRASHAWTAPVLQEFFVKTKPSSDSQRLMSWWV